MDASQLRLLNNMKRDIDQMEKQLEALCVLRTKTNIWLVLKAPEGENGIVFDQKNSTESMENILDLIELYLRRALDNMKAEFEEL